LPRLRLSAPRSAQVGLERNSFTKDRLALSFFAGAWSFLEAVSIPDHFHDLDRLAIATAGGDPGVDQGPARDA
jgi:hypothetical protein